MNFIFIVAIAQGTLVWIDILMKSILTQTSCLHFRPYFAYNFRTVVKGEFKRTREKVGYGQFCLVSVHRVNSIIAHKAKSTMVNLFSSIKIR